MAEFKSIPLDRIFVPERLRAVEEDHALTIQASIVEHGLINPITVRLVPNQSKGKKPYVLITGAHRLRAVELLDETEIEALVVEADADEAQLLEITENLFRNELSALDRAMFVMSYREVWQRKHGKIARGGDRKSNRQLDGLPAQNVLDLIADEAARGFSAHVAERLGLSVSAVERAQRVAQQLAPELRRSLRGTADADNQSLLIKLARLPAERQRQIATGVAQGHKATEALQLTDMNAKAREALPAQEAILERLIGAWARADEATRARFLEHAGAKPAKPRERLPKLSELMAEAEAGGATPTRSQSSN